jgi:hypothetical protein
VLVLDATSLEIKHPCGVGKPAMKFLPDGSPRPMPITVREWDLLNEVILLAVREREKRDRVQTRREGTAGEQE